MHVARNFQALNNIVSENELLYHKIAYPFAHHRHNWLKLLEVDLDEKEQSQASQCMA